MDNVKITVLPYSNKHEKQSFMKVKTSRTDGFYKKEKVEKRAIKQIDSNETFTGILPVGMNSTGRVWSF